MKPSISIIIITKNEADDIRECLQSATWADEVIVLDSGSSDETLSIAHEFTKNVYINTNWQGFGIQKNRALSYATCDWVLSIDADERISVELKAEIQSAIAKNNSSIYLIPRLSSYCGKSIHHAGWYPDYVARLFKINTAKFSTDLVHESLVFTAPPSKLKFPLIHKTYKNLEEVINKINLYSTLSAQDSYKKGKKGGLFMALSHGLWAFIRTYIIRAGFLDGAQGLMLAISNAEVTYYRYLKLYFLNKS